MNKFIEIFGGVFSDIFKDNFFVRVVRLFEKLEIFVFGVKEVIDSFIVNFEDTNFKF